MPPDRRGIGSGSSLPGGAKAPANNWIRVDALKQAVVTGPIVPNVGRVDTLINDQLALIWQNEATPEEAMQAIQAQVQELLDEGF